MQFTVGILSIKTVYITMVIHMIRRFKTDFQNSQDSALRYEPLSSEPFFGVIRLNQSPLDEKYALSGCSPRRSD